MLKFYMDKEKDEFKIVFDVPVNDEAAKHPEFSSLTRIFKSKKEISFAFNNGRDITGIKGNLTSFKNCIDEMLPSREATLQKACLNKILLKGNQPPKGGLNVNFHQKPFDTSDRYWNFILNQGHFISYFFNRINWYIAPQNEFVTDFPLHVDLESASTCNMNCPMCYRDQLKETGQMDIDLFKMAIDECAANNVFSIRLSWRGETLTHPKIQEMIAYATGKIKNVSFLTNAFYLTEDIIACLITNNVSYVAVSFDGIGNIYESIRHPAKFQENYHKLENLRIKRDAAGSRLPQVRLCTIWPAIKEDPDGYYRTMKTVSDYIVYNPYINFKGPMKIKSDFICQYPWERIVIGFNGEAQCCTGWNADDIILGNIKEKSIYEMWHSDLMNSIRYIHSDGDRMKLNSCKNCRHGTESATDIHIRDIVNRRY